MELLCKDLPKPLLESHLIILCEAINSIECLVQIAQSKHSNAIIYYLITIVMMYG